MSSATASVVLARKYRPRNFAQMVGQEHVVRALTNALSTRRLHHAYLFTGTRGIGKTTVSRILAKSLNCTGVDGQGDVTPQPCGQCSACREIDADRFMDYIELDAASNRGIDEARDLIERAAYKPSVGRFKVFMIDEAHQLTKDAFNALLKTLEEPPDYLKFVLATTDPEKMLPTVLSRCLQFNLRPMAPDMVRSHLAHVLEAEGVDADAGSLRLLGRAARGSMRDALSLTDQAIAFGGGRLDERVVRAMLGSVDRSHASALVQALARRDGAALLATIATLREHGLSAAGTLDELIVLLQQMAVAQAVPGALEPDDDEAADALALAAELPADETQFLYSLAVHGRAELALMDDEHAALTMVLLRLFAFAPSAPARDDARAAAPRAQPLRAPPPPALVVPAPALQVQGPLPTVEVDIAPPSTAPVAAPAADLDRWCALIRQLDASGTINALTRELAWQAGVLAVKPLATGGQCWTLTVESDTLRSEAARDKLQTALSARLSQPVQLELQAGVPADSLARREAAERLRLQAQAEEAIRADPVVVELLSQFPSARIVPGSIKPLSPAVAPADSANLTQGSPS